MHILGKLQLKIYLSLLGGWDIKNLTITLFLSLFLRTSHWGKRTLWIPISRRVGWQLSWRLRKNSRSVSVQFFAWREIMPSTQVKNETEDKDMDQNTSARQTTRRWTGICVMNRKWTRVQVFPYYRLQMRIGGAEKIQDLNFQTTNTAPKQKFDKWTLYAYCLELHFECISIFGYKVVKIPLTIFFIAINIKRLPSCQKSLCH